MAMQFNLGKVDFELGTQTSFAPQKARDDSPFCIAILGDFSGRANRGICETGPALAGSGRTAVDVDNFDRLPSRLGAEIHIPLGGKDGPRVAVRFDEPDDFHPDRIFDRLEVFQKLKETRKGLQDPATFEQAASQMRCWAAPPPDTARPEPAKAQTTPAESRESDADTIQRLLGKQPTQQRPAAPAAFASIDELIRRTVKPYIVPAPHPQQADLVAQLDRAISGQMLAILHHPDCQQLEAGWRTLNFLISRLETDETLKLYVFDISKAELASDLASADRVQFTATYRLVAEQSVNVPGAEQWAILLGCYTFDQTADDINLLQRLATVAQAAGAPLMAGASSHFAGCHSLAATPDPNDWQWQPDPAAAQLWQQLRRSPEAASVGLVLPRVLLRLPYGKDTESIERFAFEEFSPLGDHEQYLWGNPAAVCVCLLGAVFREYGWSLTDGLGRDMAGIPMHVYKSAGETLVTPCAETILTERAMQVLIDKGLIPLLSIKGQDAVRIPRFQSIAERPTPLAGRWR
ncbi:MAG TPA: type VI secretion system contractile sheath large subunit [Sedimentisphaerales bacterium]|nr:type VI secretion system contractile sheath large subunit [Sedimentisphaerales bacterium]